MPPKVTTVWIYSREIIWPHKRFGPKYGANNFSKLELEYCSFSCLLTWRIHPRLTSTIGSNPLWSSISNSSNPIENLRLHRQKGIKPFKNILSFYNHNINNRVYFIIFSGCSLQGQPLQIQFVCYCHLSVCYLQSSFACIIKSLLLSSSSKFFTTTTETLQNKAIFPLIMMNVLIYASNHFN